MHQKSVYVFKGTFFFKYSSLNSHRDSEYSQQTLIEMCAFRNKLGLILRMRDKTEIYI